MGFFKKKSAQYKAAIRVEKYRARAVELREHDPDTFAEMVASADGSEAERVAQRDPVAYVALMMAAWDDAKVTPRDDYGAAGRPPLFEGMLEEGPECRPERRR